MNTHRCNLGADTVITCWVRDDAGRRDLSSPGTATVYVYPYGRGVEAFTIDAICTAQGRVRFTVTEDQAARNLRPGPFRFSVLFGSENVYSGLLEAV